MKYYKNINLIVSIVLGLASMTACKKENTVGTPSSGNSTSGNNTGGTTSSGLTLGSNSPVPVGSTLNLMASSISSATYYWSGPNCFYSSDQNATKANFTVADAGNYTCTASTGGYYGSSHSASISVSAK